LALAHVSQSLVVVIVGLNLGFRKDSLEIWKTFLRKRVPSLLSGTSVAASAPEQFAFDSKAYD
jgi:hypothetical protein